MSHSVESTTWRLTLIKNKQAVKLNQPIFYRYFIMLHTTDYKHFRLVYPDGHETSFEGASYAHRALPGDTLQINGPVKKVTNRAKHLPLVGIVELNSKIRFGMTAKNIPIYKFIPFNESYPPFFVGCSQKDLSRNILGRVEFLNWDSGTCPRGNLIEIIGPCGDILAEQRALLIHNCPEKWLKGELDYLIPPHLSENTIITDADTFHIDPPGCRDIDDAISIIPESRGYTIKIHIADVGAWIMTNPVLKKAAIFGQTYYIDGVAVKPMFPQHLSEDLFSLIPGKERQTVTFSFLWDSLKKAAYLDESYWTIEMITVRKSYTYETVYDSPYAPILAELCSSLACKSITDSHEWVEQLMLTYNTQVAVLLKALGTGILRRHAGKDHARFEKLEGLGLPAHKLAMRAGEYCSPFEDTVHWGLNRSAYCHASSPIRRWADCINQLALRDIIDSGQRIQQSDLCSQADSLNILGRRAKYFEREILFMRAILEKNKDIEAIIVEIGEKVKLWVPAWNRIVSSKHLAEAKPGDRVKMSFFADMTQSSWKRRMVIRWALEN
jgi:exoribonuclease R